MKEVFEKEHVKRSFQIEPSTDFIMPLDDEVVINFSNPVTKFEPKINQTEFL